MNFIPSEAGKLSFLVFVHFESDRPEINIKYYIVQHVQNGKSPFKCSIFRISIWHTVHMLEEKIQGSEEERIMCNGDEQLPIEGSLIQWMRTRLADLGLEEQYGVHRHVEDGAGHVKDKGYFMDEQCFTGGYIDPQSCCKDSQSIQYCGNVVQ